MKWKPLPTAPRLLPFRAACAGLGRPNLLDKLSSRPTVAVVPTSTTARVEEQDAVLSGMTRSLHRRVSGLNIPVALQGNGVQRWVA